MLLMTFPLFSQNKNMDEFDWQGHRGCRGLMPENTIPAFLKALEYPVTTLELDLAVSKDYTLIVSHEPWMSEHICSKPDGTPVLGPTPYDNLYLSAGHGTLGWTMAAGTGKVLADLLSRRQPEIDMEGLTLARYQAGAPPFHPLMAPRPC